MKWRVEIKNGSAHICDVIWWIKTKTNSHPKLKMILWDFCHLKASTTRVNVTSLNCTESFLWWVDVDVVDQFSYFTTPSSSSSSVFTCETQTNKPSLWHTLTDSFHMTDPRLTPERTISYCLIWSLPDCLLHLNASLFVFLLSMKPAQTHTGKHDEEMSLINVPGKLQKCWHPPEVIRKTLSDDRSV